MCMCMPASVRACVNVGASDMQLNRMSPASLDTIVIAAITARHAVNAAAIIAELCEC